MQGKAGAVFPENSGISGQPTAETKSSVKKSKDRQLQGRVRLSLSQLLSWIA